MSDKKLQKEDSRPVSREESPEKGANEEVDEQKEEIVENTSEEVPTEEVKTTTETKQEETPEESAVADTSEESKPEEPSESESEKESDLETVAVETPEAEEVEAVSEKKEEEPAKAEAEVESVSEVDAAKDQEEEEEEEEEVSSSDDEEHKDEEAEEETVQKDYHSLSKQQLIAELRSLLKANDVQKIKHDVEEIRSEFAAKFAEELEQQKEEFLAAGGNIIDFHYSTPLRKEFNTLYFDYKEKRNRYYRDLKQDLQVNLNKRLELIEELKGLLSAEENINSTYKHFKEIQDRWHVAGPIPRDKYNIVWNTYRHHVENFYDFLHLNREFRDLDFKHNLEQKLKIINRTEELAQTKDINKAFRELQMLHKMWKEDIGPVAKEYRDEVWDKFSAATKIIHDKRQEFLKDQDKYYEENYTTKMELIEKIDAVKDRVPSSHQGWQKAIKEVQGLRDQYFEIGKVPRNKNKEIWNSFKEVTRGFNREKNAFYKGQKKEQFTNLEKKRELIKIAEENKDSDDFEVVTPLMKKIQSDWKKIGHVPRRDSDKVWKQFKDACNYYFDRVHAERNEANKEELEHYEAKSKLLEEMEKWKASGDQDKDLEEIKAKIKEWKEIGRVPFNKRNIERKFNKVLDGQFKQLKLDKQEMEMIRFENKVSSMVTQEDDRKLQNEEFFISKKIGETKDEIRQLENNLGFFQHADQENPMVKEVHNNIAKTKEQLEVWIAKLKKIRALRNG